MSKVRAWLLASRPATLTAAFTPVAVGTACAYAVHRFAWGPAVAALFGAFCIQIGTNFANDVFDFERGADTATRLGPMRAVQAGLISPFAMRFGMWAAFVLAALAGLYLTAVAGVWVLAIGLASIVSGMAYTGGPYPLGYHGLGDLFVLIFFGFVAVCGTTFVQAGSVPALAVWAALPVGSLATAILVVNNLRDRLQDAQAGKRTLAVRWGVAGARAEFALLLSLAYAVPIVTLFAERLSPWLLLPLATLPLAIRIARRLSHFQGRDLNGVLKQTAQLLLIHGGLWSVGIALCRATP